MNTLQIKVETELIREIEQLVKSTMNLGIDIDVVDIKDKNLDFLYEQAILYIQYENIFYLNQRYIIKLHFCYPLHLLIATIT